MSVSKFLRTIAALGLLASIVSCSGTGAESAAEPTLAAPTHGGSASPAQELLNPTESEHSAVSTDIEQIREAVEAAFSTKNGSARWEGETMVLSIDGDAEESMAGFTPCRVLVQLLPAEHPSVIQFPNGRVDCGQ